MFLALLLQVHQVFTGYWKFSHFPTLDETRLNIWIVYSRLSSLLSAKDVSHAQERRLRQCQKFPTDDVDECLHDQVVMEFQN